MRRNQMFKKGFIISLWLLVLGLSLGATTVALAKQDSSNPDKVSICHKPGIEDEKSLEVARKGWEQGHSKHGDVLGQCVPSGRIAFVSDRDGNNEIYLMNADGSGVIRCTTNGSAERLPSLSPDGNKIAFGSDRDGNGEIYVMDIVVANGDCVEGNVIRLTNDPALDDGPAWSPDGSKIAFESTRDINTADIFIINADGTGILIKCTNRSVPTGQAEWSPDGSQIAFYSLANGNDIFVINSDCTGIPTNLTAAPGNDQEPEWSPSGSQIAFVGGRDGSSEIYVMDAAGTNQTRCTFNPASDAGPTWSPDGSMIAFSFTERWQPRDLRHGCRRLYWWRLASISY